MKRIKNFKDFINEDLFTEPDEKTRNFLSTFGRIILNRKSGHYGEELDPIQNDGSSAPVIGSFSGLSSPLGSYSSPELGLSSKYSVLSRYPEAKRDDSDVFQICLHHTDGENTRGEDIIKYVFGQGKGSSVHYAIGRDGQLVKGTPENETVWAANGLNPHSVSIEISTGGGVHLKESKWMDGKSELNKKYYPYIVDLGYIFNGYNYYLDYTDGQIKALKDFFDIILKKYPKIKEGMKGNVYEKVFGIPQPKLGGEYTSKKLTEEQSKGPGVYIHAVAPKATHTDCFPSSKLVNFLKEYGYTGEVIESKYLYKQEEPEKEKEKKDEKPGKIESKKEKGISADIYDPYLNVNPATDMPKAKAKDLKIPDLKNLEIKKPLKKK